MSDLVDRLRTEVIHLSARIMADDVTPRDAQDVQHLIGEAIDEIETLNMRCGVLLSHLDHIATNATNLAETHRQEIRKRARK